ncbi:MAG: hypothetical protein COV47_02410 [Candidatus Diapherotrites archaeon CG11_big_fil_rev_8_21_14_0_20_37_9]|nr:MAG: hypothetical protein COV47_02410 [Candidatus Diapherotrites archaeon CG11_big_fil_rev_8_21_14_0_20_37_9]
MGYWHKVNELMREADIIIQVLDARFPVKTRIESIDEFAEIKGKKLLYVLNKSDLVSKRFSEKAKKGLPNAVFVSAKKRMGKIKLKEAIGKLAGNNEVKIAIVGYPNTGKSSIINMLKGRKSARTSPTAGFTRGKQLIRISHKVMLIDSPGVMPFNEKDESTMVLLNAKNSEQIKDVEGVALELAKMLLENNPKKLVETYGIEAKDEEEFLEKLAVKRNKLKKGGIPDVNQVAAILIKDFQTGKIGI